MQDSMQQLDAFSFQNFSSSYPVIEAWLVFFITDIKNCLHIVVIFQKDIIVKFTSFRGWQIRT